ncbi:phage tail tube protein [Nocardioides sp.]|uniref:phage tail tube protein n=1 Tax=Nocardioides sp. TaxID=35761 RepID=UPI0035AFF757
MGFSAESTYGTYVAPTRWFPASNFNVQKGQNVVEASGVAAGRSAPVDDVVTTSWATGGAQFDVLRKGFGLILAQFLGSSATPVQQGATAAYLQTHALGDNFGKSLTMQGGLPNAAGTVNPMTATGSKITKLELSCQLDGLVQATIEIDGKTYTEAQALAAPSYLTSNPPFHFGEMTVKLGTFGAEAAVQGVRGVTISMTRPQATDRFYGGNSGSKSEPIWNDFIDVSGSFDVDFVTKADFHDRWTGNTATSAVVEWVGPTAIASTFFPTLRITCPKVKFGSGIGEVGGPDVIKGSIPFKAKLDETNGVVSAAYMSTDTAV